MLRAEVASDGVTGRGCSGAFPGLGIGGWTGEGGEARVGMST
jgi:hypothetical protein